MNHYASIEGRTQPFFTVIGASGTTHTDIERCPAGQMLVGGGGQIGGPGVPNAVLVASYASIPGIAGTWTTVWFHDTAVGASVRTFALCAPV